MGRQVPKNVRQIGNVSDSSKIYIEDYVDTFFNQLCEKADQKPIGAFLVGEKVQEEETDYIYVYGAIEMKELITKGKDYVIDNETWKNACETCKEYFGSGEILGWFVTGGNGPIEMSHGITKMHQKHFPREKTLFVSKDSRDKEEKCYVYKFRNMMEIGGHYVYYERNPEMQNYMIACRKKAGMTAGEMIEDRVTKSFRSLVQEKEKKNVKKEHSGMVYAMSTFLVLVLVIVGVSMINNYQKMQNVDNALETLGGSVSSETSGQGAGSGTKEDKKDKEPGASGGESTKPDIDPEKSNQGVGSEKPNTGEGSAKSDEEGESSTSRGPEGSLPEETVSSGQGTGQSVGDQTSAGYSEAYIVEKGDTLESICREKYGSTTRMKEVCKLNNLQDGNLIYIGQKLLLP